MKLDVIRHWNFKNSDNDHVCVCVCVLSPFLFSTTTWSWIYFKIVQVRRKSVGEKMKWDCQWFYYAGSLVMGAWNFTLLLYLHRFENFYSVFEKCRINNGKTSSNANSIYLWLLELWLFFHIFLYCTILAMKIYSLFQ